MPNQLTTERVALADHVRTSSGLAVYTTAPEEPRRDDDEPGGSPYPLVYVLPGEPYIDYPEGTPFGHAVLHCNVSAVAASGTSDVEAEQLDDMLTKVLEALFALDDDWTIGEVQQPGRVVLNNRDHLAVAVECTRLIQLAP